MFLTKIKALKNLLLKKIIKKELKKFFVRP